MLFDGGVAFFAFDADLALFAVFAFLAVVGLGGLAVGFGTVVVRPWSGTCRAWGRSWSGRGPASRLVAVRPATLEPGLFPLGISGVVQAMA